MNISKIELPKNGIETDKTSQEHHAGPDANEIEKYKTDMMVPFNLTDEGDLRSDNLGIKITKLQDGRSTLTLPQLINSIITGFNFSQNTKPKDIPANSSILLQ